MTAINGSFILLRLALTKISAKPAIVKTNSYLLPHTMKTNYKVVLGLMLSMLYGAASAQTARLQVIHNAADVNADSVDVWINDTKALPKFAFRTATPYLEVPANTALQVRIKGKNSTDTLNPLFFRTYSLPANSVVALIANGVLNPAQYAANPSGAGTGFDLYAVPGATTAAAAGSSSVYVWHGATDAPAVNILARTGASGVHAPLLRSLRYGITLPAAATLPAASAELEVNTTNNEQTAAAFTAPLNAFADSALIVLASGFLNPAANQNGAAFGLLAVTAGGRAIMLPAATNSARVQIIHASPDTALANVSVYINGVQAIAAVPYKDATGFIPVPTGAPFRVHLTRTTATDTVGALFSATYNLNPGQKVSLIARGVVSPVYRPNPDASNAFNLQVVAPARPQANSLDSVTINYVHASPDAPAVRAKLNGAVAAPRLTFGQHTGYVTLRRGTNTMELALAANALFPIGSFVNPNGADSAYQVVVTGFANPAANAAGDPLNVIAVRADGFVRTLPITAAPTASANVQLVHNSPDVNADTVDVWVNDVKLVPNFAFRTATPYVPVPAGQTLEIRVAPKNSTDTSAKVYFRRALLPAGVNAILTADGVLNPAQYAPNPNGESTRFSIFAIAGARAATTAGSVALQINHGSTDAPTVNLLARNGITGVHVPILRDFPYGSILTGFSPFPAQNLVLEVNPRNNDATVAAYQAPFASFRDSALYVLASGFLNPAANQNGPAFGLLAVTAGGRAIMLPAASNEPRIQIIHASPDTGLSRVDIWLGNTRALSNVRYLQATPHLAFPSGPVRVIITRPGAPDTLNALFKNTYTLQAGQKLALVARGVAFPGFAPSPTGSNAFDLAVLANSRPQSNDEDTVSIRYFHASPDAPAVAATVNGSPAISSISFGNASRYFNLLRTAPLNTALTTTGTPAAPVGNFLSPRGADSAYHVVITGFLTPSANANGPGLVAMSVRGDGRVTVQNLITVSLAGNVNNNLPVMVFPNPVTQGEINVEGAVQGALNWQLTDMAGRAVESGATTNMEGNSRISIRTAVQPGVYMLSLQSQDGKRYTQRLLVQ